MIASMHKPTRFYVGRDGSYIKEDMISMAFGSENNHIKISADIEYVKNMISSLTQQLKYMEDSKNDRSCVQEGVTE